ncbi:MAG: PKD domain-containing protein [Bacteroidota bacterium]|nr:PKD domain-containing protein [Bacteroidota bacterium]
MDSALMDLDAIEIYMWDFGDGSGPIYQMNPTHTYSLGGHL